MDKFHIFTQPPGAQLSNWAKTKHLKVPTPLPERINPESAAGKAITAEKARLKRTSSSQDQDTERDNNPPPPPRSNKLDVATNKLSDLTPPLYHLPNIRATRKTPQSKERHIDVLNTVLHTCLLDGDFERASRAFGLLLRAGSMGPRFLRDRIVAGIGTEVLLRRDNSYRDNDDRTPSSSKANNKTVDDDGDEQMKSTPSTPPPIAISPATFALVHTYLENLYIHFPMKSRFGLDDQLNFFPAFYTIWVYQIIEAERQSLEANTSSQGNETIRLQTLRSAEDLSRSLTDRVGTPPTDKDPELLELRGFISLWLADLVVSVNEAANDEKSQGGRQKYLDEADEWFGKAKEVAEKQQNKGYDSEGAS